MASRSKMSKAHSSPGSQVNRLVRVIARLFVGIGFEGSEALSMVNRLSMVILGGWEGHQRARHCLIRDGLRNTVLPCLYHGNRTFFLFLLGSTGSWTPERTALIFRGVLRFGGAELFWGGMASGLKLIVWGLLMRVLMTHRQLMIQRLELDNPHDCSRWNTILSSMVLSLSWVFLSMRTCSALHSLTAYIWLWSLAWPWKWDCFCWSKKGHL